MRALALVRGQTSIDSLLMLLLLTSTMWFWNVLSLAARQVMLSITPVHLPTVITSPT